MCHSEKYFKVVPHEAHSQNSVVQVFTESETHKTIKSQKNIIGISILYKNNITECKYRTIMFK